MNAKLQRLFAALLVLGTALGIATFASDARAAGVFKLKSSTVEEVSGGWHVFVEIQVAKAPSTPHTTMRFLFTKQVVYERALTDNGPDPVLNRQVVQNQTPSVESLDVDFSDPRGKIYNRTRFDFTLTRPRGYEAGEYKVQLRTGDGVDVGGPLTVILKGDNPVVDRRSITFSAGKGNIKKVDNGVDAGPQVASNQDNSAAPASTDVSPSGSAAPFIPGEAYNKTPEEEQREHPKGCGCTTPGSTAFGGALLALAPLAGAAVFARRRRRVGPGLAPSSR